MDQRVLRLMTPEECEVFARNVMERGKPELARQALRRKVHLRALTQNPQTSVETEAYEALFLYEEALTIIANDGRKRRAGRTWPMVKEHGILRAIEMLVKKDNETSGYQVLVNLEMLDMSFEAVVDRHPEIFSEEAVTRARQRLAKWEYTG